MQMSTNIILIYAAAWISERTNEWTNERTNEWTRILRNQILVSCQRYDTTEILGTLIHSRGIAGWYKIWAGWIRTYITFRSILNCVHGTRSMTPLKVVILSGINIQDFFLAFHVWPPRGSLKGPFHIFLVFRMAIKIRHCYQPINRHGSRDTELSPKKLPAHAV